MRKVKPGKNSLNLISGKAWAQHAALLQGFVTLSQRKSALKSAVRVQRQRGAKQHAGDDQSDYASSEPSGTHGHPEERRLANRVLRDPCDERAICSRGRLGPTRLISSSY